jgi:hypothetical protein
MRRAAWWADARARCGCARVRAPWRVCARVPVAEMLDGPALRFGVPVLAHLVPPEHHRWLPVAVRTLAKTLAVCVAWYLQVVISAVQSAMRGGLMCSRAMLRWAAGRGLIEQPSADDAALAEAVGYAVALVGCYCQCAHAARAPRWVLPLLPLPCTQTRAAPRSQVAVELLAAVPAQHCALALHARRVGHSLVGRLARVRRRALMP